MRAHEFVARWLHDMDTATEWEDEPQRVRNQYLRDTDAFLREPQNLAIRAEAWDEGAKWAAVETDAIRDERNNFLAPGDNPYRPQT